LLGSHSRKPNPSNSSSYIADLRFILVTKETQGKANPQMVNKILKENLIKQSIL
jgi:hypothetical protein